MIVGDKWAGLLDELLEEAAETRESAEPSSRRYVPKAGPGPYVRVAERAMSGGVPEWVEGVSLYRVPVLVTGQVLLPDEGRGLNGRYGYAASVRGRYLRMEGCIVAAVPWYPNRNRGGHYVSELSRLVGIVSGVFQGEPFHAVQGPWQSFRGRACVPILPACLPFMEWSKWNMCGSAVPFLREELDTPPSTG